MRARLTCRSRRAQFSAIGVSLLVAGVVSAPLPAAAQRRTTTTTTKPAPPIAPPVTGVVNPITGPAAQALMALKGPVKDATTKAEKARQALVQADADALARQQEATTAAARFEEAKKALVSRAQADYVAPVHLPTSGPNGNPANDPTRALEYLRVRLVSGATAVVEARDTRRRLEKAQEAATKTAAEAKAQAEVAETTLALLSGLQVQQTQLAQGLEGSGDEAPDGEVALIPPPLVSAEGIVVHVAIGQQVANLIAASRAAGLRLGGSGYRTPGRQVELRRAHCGPTDFEVFHKPSGQCSPPTARPGRSMHERGLAIDFTDDGALIVSRDEPAFQWLAANAALYGLQNLSSEPWHWSINGR